MMVVSSTSMIAAVMRPRRMSQRVAPIRSESSAVTARAAGFASVVPVVTGQRPAGCATAARPSCSYATPVISPFQ